MKPYTMITLATLVTLLTLAAAVPAAQYNGRVSAGYIYLDEEGNEGVFQPTYNLYEGAALSLEDLYYIFNNGVRLYGDFENVTLNNRNIVFGISKSRLFGASIRHNQYRRSYSFDGDIFTRRNSTRGEAWVYPHRLIKLFGGAGYVDKHGALIEKFTEPPLGNPLVNYDYDHIFYNAGVTVGTDSRFATFEFRGSDFSEDELDANKPDLGGGAWNGSDRMSRRYRASAFGRVPRLDNLYLHGGFQRFEHEVKDFEDTLIANTGWAGARYFIAGGWSLRYNFIWDRARRTASNVFVGDLTSTDNITHAGFVDKRFRNFAGVTAGYQYRINDDVRDEIEGNSFVVSGWVRPIDPLTLRAGYGTDVLEVQTGRTLLGDRDQTRYWISGKYRHRYGIFQAKVENRLRDYDDIGTSADFLRAATNLIVELDRYGRLSAAYAYYNGDYNNRENSNFAFEEHVLSGELLSAAYYGFRVGFGGMYYRTRLDQDIESFSLTFRAVYEFLEHYAVEAAYSAHNYDNFADLTGLYDQYYTANVARLNLIYDFGGTR